MATTCEIRTRSRPNLLRDAFDALGSERDGGRSVQADAIADVNRRAQIKAADIVDAADRQSAALLALQARDNGKVALEEVVQRFEQITRLDPGRPWDWIELARFVR